MFRRRQVKYEASHSSLVLLFPYGARSRAQSTCSLQLAAPLLFTNSI